MKTKYLFFWTLIALVSCSNLAYQPSSQKYFDPSQFKLTYEELQFPSKQGPKLTGWFFPAATKEVKGTIIQFHGNAENISTHFLSLAWVVYEGYNLFTFDYQSYGNSEGKATQEGTYLDALAALEEGYELNQTRGGKKFVVYGQSLGGNICARALVDFKYKDKVTLLVQDSTFSSYKKIALNRVASVWFLWPISPLGYFLVSDEYASAKVINKIRTPVLVIVGKKDSIVPEKFGKQIYKQLKSEKKWLWKFPEGRHIDIFGSRDGVNHKRFLALVESLPPM